ncbi:MAG: hypothetical protein KIG36_06385 [Eubacteriales bacterium]|nr:hypothetical protein [Eubacteriales bacterium]
MIVYAVLLFAAAALILGIAAAIYRGNTRLIHDYHQKNVAEDKRRDYGRAFAGGLFVAGAALVIGGVIALFGESPALVASAVGVPIGGLIGSVVVLLLVQKKYNGGLF